MILLPATHPSDGHTYEHPALSELLGVELVPSQVMYCSRAQRNGGGQLVTHFGVFHMISADAHGRFRNRSGCDSQPSVEYISTKISLEGNDTTSFRNGNYVCPIATHGANSPVLHVSCHSRTTPTFSGLSWERGYKSELRVNGTARNISCTKKSHDRKGRCLVIPHSQPCRAVRLTHTQHSYQHGLSPGAHECGHRHKYRPCAFKESTCSFSSLFTPTKRRH